MPKDETAIPTQNVEAEQALIGAALLDNGVLDRCQALIKPQHFYDGLHSRIWHNMLKRQEKGQRSTPTLLAPTFAEDRDMSEVGGPAYLATLAGAAITTFDAPDYAKQVRELWQRREVRELLSDARDAMISTDDIAAVCERMEDQFAKINDLARAEERAHSWQRAVSEMIDQVGEAYQSDGAAGLTTGIPQLDDLTGGMMAPEVWTIGARTSMGKSAVALHIALKQAQAGQGVLICSMEMAPKEMALRMASAICAQRGRRIEYQALRRGNVSEADMRMMVETMREVMNLPIIITPPTMRSSGAILAEARDAQRRFETRKGGPVPMGSIILDYVQRMRVPSTESRVDEITEAMRVTKDLAVKHNCPVMPLAQINRGAETRANEGKGSIPRPRLSDLKGAGAIEEDSDVVLILHRDEYYIDKWKPSNSQQISEKHEHMERAKGKMDIYVDKFRNGAQTELVVDIDLPTNTIKEPEQDRQSGMDFG